MDREIEVTAGTCLLQWLMALTFIMAGLHVTSTVPTLAELQAGLLFTVRVFALIISYCFCGFIFPFVMILHVIDNHWGIWPAWLWGPQRQVRKNATSSATTRVRRRSTIHRE
ncbi:hypothetical protein SAMD00023353_1500860 [Rosellinia necatrix]|uniref:Uncharacterized protein n=1 Tax=Rosellinia necatrix TaxID=77044 RepID=A0A1W2TIX3_ROSNE|nr:hypothetical protein SAMD00023353_1500860 [Rosellinia necatrix]